METSVAKRPRLEPQPRNAEEIIQEQRQVIENQKAQIQNLEERNQQLEEQLKNPTSSAMEIDIKNVPVPKLPNEVWLEIMSYLSTYEVLRNVAQVSKRFHKLSEDPHVIRKIEVESVQSWPKDKEEKYCNDFLGVVKRSLKLKILSFGFGYDIDNKSGQMFLEALPSLNHQFLHEFCLKGDGKKDYSNAAGFFDPLNENILKYVEMCPELKVLKFEFKPQTIEFDEEEERKCRVEYPYLNEMVEGIKKFKLKNLKEFHLIGVDNYMGGNFFFLFGEKKFLETITENFPKLQLLCVTLQYDVWHPQWNNIFQKFASEKSIKIEISSVLKCVCGHAPDCNPYTDSKYFYPK